MSTGHEVRKVSIDPDDDYYEMLDHGYVRFVDKLGSDEKIVQAARTSYNGVSKGEAADRKLLRYLFLNAHTSPFEMASITFEIYMPIFVARQIMRHRTARFNEMSGRYTEMPEDCYVPSLLRVQDKKNKQGSVPCEGFVEPISQFQFIAKVSFETYRRLLEQGVCREQARMVLPLGTYTKVVMNIDLNNLIKFLRLRDHSHAQWETQQYAVAMKKIAARHFPWTMEVFEDSLSTYEE